MSRRSRRRWERVAGPGGWLVAACLLASCGDGKQVTMAAVRFANDDSGLVIVHESYRLHHTDGLWGGSTSTSDHRYELRVADPDGSNQRTLRAEDDRSLLSVAYEASAGYILLSTAEVNGPTWRTEIIRLDGPVEVLDEGSVGRAAFLPSPDGSVLARSRIACNTPGHPCNFSRRSVYVSFYDAATLERFGALHAVEFPPSGRTDQRDVAAWSPDGEVVVSDGVEAVAVSPDGARREVPAITCTGPTTAGGVASDGRLARYDESGRIEVVPDGAVPWPASCFGEAP